jgi:hypothetical protein
MYDEDNVATQGIGQVGKGKDEWNLIMNSDDLQKIDEKGVGTMGVMYKKESISRSCRWATAGR